MDLYPDRSTKAGDCNGWMEFLSDGKIIRFFRNLAGDFSQLSHCGTIEKLTYNPIVVWAYILQYTSLI